MNIFGTEFDYQGRLARIRKVMDAQGVDCMVVHNFTNQYYLSGHYQHWPWYPVSHNYITESPLLIFKDHDPVFLCALITLNAIKEGTWIKDVRAIDQGIAPTAMEAVAVVVKEKGLANGNIGIEETCCTAKTAQSLKKALPNATIKNAADILYLGRAVKDEAEIALMKQSIAICESAVEVAKKTARPGVSEMEVQFAMEMEMRRLGGIREIETMCQSGIRTANYRAFAAEWKKIQEGELVTVDLGVIYKGYGCDITRTWVVGEPKPEYKKIAADLYKTYELFCDFIKPGMSFAQVFDYIRGEMIKMGYPARKDQFPAQQFAIHGIGLGPFHDYPDTTHRECLFEKNMVISFQPSVRHEDFTIRFEDNLLLHDDGVELLSTSSHKLI